MLLFWEISVVILGSDQNCYDKCDPNISIWQDNKLFFDIMGSHQNYNGQHHRHIEYQLDKSMLFWTNFSLLHLLVFARFDKDFFDGDDVDTDHVNCLSLPFDQDDIINWCQFGHDDFIPPCFGLHHSVIDHPRDDQMNYNSDFIETTS